MRMFNKAEFQSFYFIFFGILTVEVCFAIGSQDEPYDDCNVSGGGICYFVGSHTKQTWYQAHRVCQDKNSSLPIIRSSEEQTAFETYLNTLSSNALKTNDIWTAGKKQVNKKWTWINGQTLNESHYRNVTIILGSAEKTHMQIYMMTGSKSTLRPAYPFSRHWYLCQFKGRQCSDEFAVNATYGCLVSSGDNKTSWYDARKSCLSEQGDLAILTDQDIQILSHSIIRNPNFWIGLRKEYWVWRSGLEIQASEGGEAKYTNWANASMRTDGDLCISINANRGKWRSKLCSTETFLVVCEKRGQNQPSTSMNSVITKSTKRTATTGATNRKPPSARPTSRPTTMRTTIATAVHEHNGDSTKFQAESLFTEIFANKETNGRTDDSKTGENTSIISGIVAGVVIFILCIVAILVVMCRKSKSSNIKTELAQIDAETMKGSKDENTKEKSSKGNEERCIYAVIPLAEKTTNDALEDGQKGTTYASLDFNKGVTMPIQTNCIQHSDVSGPIYAQPFNAIRNQNETSTGESFSIHSVEMHR